MLLYLTFINVVKYVDNYCIMSNIDILIINVPGTLSKTPLAAPAILKASIQHSGFTCRTIDFNIKFFNDYRNDLLFNDIENFFLGYDSELTIADRANEIISSWINDIIKPLNPRFVGISVFTYQSRKAAEIFSKELRLICPATKIILGGQGIPDGGINGSSTWVDKLLNVGLADHWIRSEGEEAIINLLKGHDTNVKEVEFNQIVDLDSIPFPDYSDYNFNDYERKILLLTGSRGCVRHCTFCDIHTHWKKFTWRKGKNIADEMIAQAAKYKINQFQFSDSLVNGNLKEYRNFVTHLAEFNGSQNKKIQWRGQYIIRRKAADNEDLWELTARSGANELYIGIESGSDSVRKHLNKEFTNQDIDYALEMMEKYKLKCTFLMIIGYPTETEQDFQDTIELFSRNKKYANKVITRVSLGTTLSILPNTPLHNNADNLGLVLDNKHENFWTYTHNPSLTFKERLRRRMLADKLLQELGFTISNDHDVHSLMQMWDQYKKNHHD